MKCPVCGGDGSVPYPLDYENGLFDEDVCRRCQGTGEVMSREEYIRVCSSDKLADLIYDLLWNRQRFGDLGNIKDLAVVREWLQEEYRK